MTMQLALFQPDIPQNTGSLMRLSACLGVRLHIIEPCGFVLDDKKLRRVAMDYEADMLRHASWEAFLDYNHGANRLLLLTTKAERAYTAFDFLPGDLLLLGRESAGVPDSVHARADERLKVPVAPGARSLNVVQAAAMVLGEGLRQTGGFAG